MGKRNLVYFCLSLFCAAARSAATTIHPDHIHSALRQVPAANAKITNP